MAQPHGQAIKHEKERSRFPHRDALRVAPVARILHGFNEGMKSRMVYWLLVVRDALGARLDQMTSTRNPPRPGESPTVTLAP